MCLRYTFQNDIRGQVGAIISRMLTKHKLSDLQRQEPNVTQVISNLLLKVTELQYQYHFMSQTPIQ